MNLSRHSPAPTRYVGIGLVVALHLAGIYALSAGLIKPLARPKEATILLPPIPERPREAERVRDLVTAERPTLMNVPRPDVPVPPTWLEDTPRVATEVQRGEPVVPTGNTAGAGTPAVAPPVRNGTSISVPGAVCSVMPRPEVPAVNWSGEAVLQVLATVRGGRVVGSEVRVALGALDGKTRRSLQRSVESALAGYQCQGDAMFQQEFAFRLD